MTDSAEKQLAWEFVENTSLSVFLTGKAGTGKTTFLRHVVENSRKTLIVVAPTGVAAVNAGGVTVHSFFQIPPTPYVEGVTATPKFNFSKEKLGILRALDLLVIDEISMMRSDLLDAVDATLRRTRRNSLPFGGVQLLMIGDLQQLTPVVTPADEAVLKDAYSTPYFFGSKALEKIDYVTVNLSKVYRQTDTEFVTLLNAVRENRLTPEIMRHLNSRHIPGFVPPEGGGYILLTTHNSQADAYNGSRLAALPGAERHYSATTEGIFPESAFPTSGDLAVKQGMQVMFIKNDSTGGHFYNGKIGTVTGLRQDSVTVRCPGDYADIEVRPAVWENMRYEIDKETLKVAQKKDGEFRQLPLRPAWAITIHKSQGLTFDKAVIDAGAAFAPGQVYVALSRCRSLEGMYLSRPLTQSAVITDSAVDDYMHSRGTLDYASTLGLWKEDYHRTTICRLFDFDSFEGALDRLLRIVAQMGLAYAPLASEISAARDGLAKEIMAPAHSWCGLVRSLPFAQLLSEPFNGRLRRGASYFFDALKRTVEPVMLRSLKTIFTNAALKKRANMALDELSTMYAVKMQMLSVMERERFSVTRYLQCRKDAVLSLADRDKKGNRRKKGRSAFSSSPQHKKEPKTPTRQITFDMWRQGMSRSEIARGRHLQESTIFTHLLSYVEDGVLDASDIIDRKSAQAVLEIIERNPGIKSVEIRNELPGMLLGEIYAIRRYFSD